MMLRFKKCVCSTTVKSIDMTKNLIQEMPRERNRSKIDTEIRKVMASEVRISERW